MRDHLEHYARRLWKRWIRAARYALQTSSTDAMLRYRFAHVQEVRKAMRDLAAGRSGLLYMLSRARRVARNHLRTEVEALAVRLAYAMPLDGRDALARAAARAGWAVSPSTIRRVLVRRGLWHRAA